MPNVMPFAAGNFRQQSSYVPRMQYSADVNYNGTTRVDFGVVIAADPVKIANAINIAVAGTIDLTSVAQSTQPYGRNTQVVLSGVGTGTATLNGWDYLGQPISENFTLNGATPVTGKKAFKSYRSVVVPAVGGTTMNIGTGQQLGLPYKTLRAVFETSNGALVAAGTLTAPVLTDPATAITGDPRGTYLPTTAENGVNAITAVFDCVNDVNAAGNGGLHGIAHFAS